MAPAVFLLNVCKAKNIIEFSPYYFHIYGYDFHKYDISIVEQSTISSFFNCHEITAAIYSTFFHTLCLSFLSILSVFTSLSFLFLDILQ